ncbi:DNA replication/repair protein RecF [Ectothiorhodospiraceae bacterium 2226]|nr:DNA replication/repair protein RecF [Ectothiorhodospiraceae bacterium 2226]
MTLQRLVVRDVRNLAHVELRPGSGLNLIVGHNASGKTSLLEAVHLLGLGRSFRTTQLRAIIRYGQATLTVFGEVAEPTGGLTTLGIEKSLENTRIKVQGAVAASAAALAERLPVVVLDPHSHALLEQGPRLRRQFLDWGAFHVEHGFLEHWQRYQRALRQRNAALRTGRMREAAAWEPELAQSGEAVAAARAHYAEAAARTIERTASELAGLDELVFSYQRGWASERALLSSLEQGREGDRELGHTRQGPHRADLVIRWGGQPVAQALSRGQQKTLVAAMRLAQVRLLHERSGPRCVVLADDLAAELDPGHRRQVLDALLASGAQVFVTATEVGVIPVPDAEVRTFHVEHGQFTELV